MTDPGALAAVEATATTVGLAAHSANQRRPYARTTVTSGGNSRPVQEGDTVSILNGLGGIVATYVYGPGGEVTRSYPESGVQQ